MTELQDAGRMLEAATQAAAADDLTSADELLRGVARIQEAELGPLHPDLANTLNNLAIVAEKAGRLDDAETFYRRAVAIASASLPADHPMLAASRENLEAFCRARGLPIEHPAVIQPAVNQRAAVDAPVPPKTAPLTRPVSENASRAPAMLAIGVAALVIVALFIARPWSRGRSSAGPAAASTPALAPEPVQAAPETAAPIDRTPSPKIESAPAPATARAAVSLVTVQLCRSLSTSNWRCDPAGDSVSPGPIVLYTRVRSLRDGVVVHRWYRGDTLRKSAQLRITANQAEGYRTFSRQTVDRGEWRVEVRTAAGDLLHEQRLAVR